MDKDIIIKSRKYRDHMRSTILPYLDFNKLYLVPSIWEKNIAISLDGTVIKNMDSGFEYTPKKNKSGYLYIPFRVHGKSYYMVHTLILSAGMNGLPNLNFYEINHLDGNKENNHISNLEWSTRTENLKHAKDTKLYSVFRGETNGNSRFTNKDVEDMKELRLLGFKLKDIAQSYNTSVSYMCSILNGKERKYG